MPAFMTIFVSVQFWYSQRNAIVFAKHVSSQEQHATQTSKQHLFFLFFSLSSWRHKIYKELENLLRLCPTIKTPQRDWTCRQKLLLQVCWEASAVHLDAHICSAKCCILVNPPYSVQVYDPFKYGSLHCKW